MDELDPSLQISEATGYDDGSYSTDLVDGTGNVVGTVTRSANGTTQADVSSSASSVGSDLTSILSKASNFLNGVSNAAKTVQTGITRIENAAAGAKTGFNLPTTATPYLIALGVITVAAVALGGRSSSRRS